MLKIAVTGFRGVPATWGGVEHHCEEIYSRLAAKGYKIVIYARDRYVPEEIKSYKGLTIKKLPTIYTKYTEAFIHTLLAVFDIIISDFDIVHIHAQGPCILIFLIRFFRPKIKIYFTCHGLDWERKKWPWWASLCIRAGELLSAFVPHYHIAVSKELQKYYKNRYGVSCCYIPNGVNKSIVNDHSALETWSLKPNGYFITVGRIVPEKRIEDSLLVFVKRKKSKKLVVVGESADKNGYMQKLRHIASGSENIIFTGYQFGEALASLFSCACGFITTSELEGLPLTLLEALSYGVIPIASDIPPHREILGKIHGYLFPTGDICALASCIDEVELLSEERINDFRKNVCRMITNEYNWDRSAEQHDHLYKKTYRAHII